MHDRVRQRLEAYSDGEFGVARRAWWARRIGRSVELRRELAMIEAASRVLRDHEREKISREDSVWSQVSMGLSAVDARMPTEKGRPGWGLFGPPLAATAVATAALVLWLWAEPEPEISGSLARSLPVAGSLRYLDTGGRSVLVVEDEPGLTIIWLMDEGGSGGV